MTKRSVLLAVNNAGHFIELSRVARLLDSTDSYRVLFLFGNSYTGIEKDLELCSAEEWKFIVEPKHSRSPATHRKQTSPVPFPSLRRIRNMFGEMLSIRRRILQFRAVLRDFDVELLVACEDNVGYSSHVLIQVADAQKIPTVIVPFTIANITEVAESYFDLPENRVSSDLINRLTGRLFPRWVYSYRGRKLLRLPAERILAMELSGLTSTQPWLFNSGAARTVAVESHRMLQHYLAEGLSADRLIVTGSLSDDVLFEAACNADAKRQKLFDDFGLSHGAPLLLCALPPSQFPRDCEFADYESLLSFWMESLSQVKQWNVIVRPHPRMPESAIDLIRGFGIPIALRDTASLVALCDLYLASVSATVRWAIARGIPVINYDVYHMGYRDYAGVEGVLTIDDREAFLRTLERVTHDRKYYEKIAAAQKEEMGNWGMLDGKSGARMLQLFDQVAVKKH